VRKTRELSIKRTPFRRLENEIQLQLDLSSFEKGVYFLTIRFRNFLTTRKIAKL
jgi:hypothetical protein